MQSCFEELTRRNAIRLAAALPPLDIPRLYGAEKRRRAMMVYEARLRPYLEATLAAQPTGSGMGARMARRLRARQIAEQLLYVQTGTRRPD